jgi:hypothetical protein
MQTQTKAKSKGSSVIRATRATKPKAVDFPSAQTVLRKARAVTPALPIEAMLVDSGELPGPAAAAARALASMPKPKAKPEPVKPKQIRAPGLNNRYAGSAVERWDLALVEGGTVEELAKKLGISQSIVRAHLKFRCKLNKQGVAKWRVEQTGDQVRMLPV